MLWQPEEVAFLLSEAPPSETRYTPDLAQIARAVVLAQSHGQSFITPRNGCLITKTPKATLRLKGSIGSLSSSEDSLMIRQGYHG